MDIQDKIGKAALDYVKNTSFVDETGDDESLIPNMRLMSFFAGARFVLDALKTSGREELFKQVALRTIKHLESYGHDWDRVATRTITHNILKAAKEFGAEE